MSLAGMIIKEARNVIRFALANTLTRDKWKGVEAYLDKGEKEYLTLCEAYELLNL